MNNQIVCPQITPLISNDIVKIFREEIADILKSVNRDFNLEISNEELITKYEPDISKLGLKLGIKKRNRRTLPKEVQCMGRKLDGLQCTRSRRNNSEFCLSHIKRLPYGRIDDDTYQVKEKGKRGRKKKVFTFDEEEYIATRSEIIDGTEYLVDKDNNVYTYDIEKPVFMGIKVGEVIQSV